MKYSLILVRRSQQKTDSLLLALGEDKTPMIEAMQREALFEYNRNRRLAGLPDIQMQDMSPVELIGDTGSEYQEAAGDIALFIGQNYCIVAYNDEDDVRYVWEITPFYANDKEIDKQVYVDHYEQHSGTLFGEKQKEIRKK